MRSIVDELVSTRIGGTFNQYADGPRAGLLRSRLERYLTAMSEAPVLLVGEAPGYRGARISGLPFTSERQVAGVGPAEATATIVHRVLHDLGLEHDLLLWNVVPTHPGTVDSNRPPSRAEVEAGMSFARRLGEGRHVIGVGRVAACALGAPYLRHPSHGGAAGFRDGLAAWRRRVRREARGRMRAIGSC